MGLPNIYFLTPRSFPDSSWNERQEVPPENLRRRRQRGLTCGWAPSANNLDAIVCTSDVKKRDAEVKLLLGCSSNDKKTILEFLNMGSLAAVLIERFNTPSKDRS